MKIVLIAAITADGLIARHSHELVDWSSKADKGTFVRVTKEMGTMIMGANQFHTIDRALPGRRTIVYTHHPESIAVEGVETTQESPADLVDRLEAEGVKGLAICGGAQIYTMFMKANLVDELYIVSEPVLFGQGLTLFTESLDTKIELFESTIRRGHSIVNHYKVIK